MLLSKVLRNILHVSPNYICLIHCSADHKYECHTHDVASTPETNPLQPLHIILTITISMLHSSMKSPPCPLITAVHMFPSNQLITRATNSPSRESQFQTLVLHRSAASHSIFLLAIPSFVIVSSNRHVFANCFLRNSVEEICILVFVPTR